MTKPICDTSMRMLIMKAQRGDPDAITDLVTCYTPLITKLSGRFHTVFDVREELNQAGYVGFMKALRKYNPEEPVKLITYAFPWILGEMKHALLQIESERINCISYDTEDCGLLNQSYISLTQSYEMNKLNLRLAFEKLEKDDRLLLFLRYSKDLTQKETALWLHKSQSQVSKSERRILDWLRIQLS